MILGQQIKTFSHAKAWILEQKRRVAIKSKKGGVIGEHSWKVVANIPFESLYKMMDQGRLYEVHSE